MPGRELRNRPLVEARVEIRWELAEQPSPGVHSDPHYQMLLGRFYERVMAAYPEHQTLPDQSLPETHVAYRAQHLFRVARDQWPLLKIGPGTLSLHQREGYHWDDFAAKSKDALEKLFAAYPKAGALRIRSLGLGYTNAVDFDYLRQDTLEFLRDKFETRMELPAKLFENVAVQARPVGLSWATTFEQDRPPGTISLRFWTGERDSRPAIFWESSVESTRQQLPDLPQDFEPWLRQAGEISHDWFSKLIAGDLETTFSGD